MKRALVAAVCVATSSIASAQSIPKPDVTYLANVMDCEANGIDYCYAHALLKETTHYKAYFFAPANPAYRLGSTECIYVARSTTLVSSSWEVYSGATWDAPPYGASGSLPTEWVPVVCDTMATQAITAAGSGFANAGWSSMQNQVWVTYTDGPPKQIQYHLAPGSAVASHAHYGTATGVWTPPGYKPRKITFDYQTNYDNAMVFAGVTMPGNATVWTNDVYGDNSGWVSLDIPADTPWIGFGLFSKTAFTVPSSNWVFRVKNATIHYVRTPTLIGDPAVFKHNGMYYMLYSFNNLETGPYVYGAVSGGCPGHC